jgi:hypothetical protein
MIQALVAKELREVAVIALLALAAHLVCVVSMTGSEAFGWVPLGPGRLNEIPFVGDTFASCFWMISAAFCLVLGFYQTLPEDSRETYRLLLWRPTTREAIFAVKFLVGLAVFWSVSAIPILLLGAWAATPGNHPSPFEWSMTAPAWWVWLTAPIFYLGAFVSGLRPARWFGTRLTPLLASILLLVVVQGFAWSPVGLLALGAVVFLFAGDVLWVARERDFA